MKKKLNIWQLTVGEPIPHDGENIRLHRAGLMSEWLAERGHQVTFINSSFFHQKRLKGNMYCLFKISLVLKILKASLFSGISNS